MNTKIATYLNNAKSAFSFVFDDGCYYDSTVDTYEIQKNVFEKTGIKIKITSAQTVGFVGPTIKKLWEKLFEEGYFDLCGHSVNHCLCYCKDADMNELDTDARETKEKLESMYSCPVLTFATPGGGNDTVGCEVLKKYYLANRNGREEINDTYNMDLFDVGVFIARFAYGNEPYYKAIDDTVNAGGWTVQVNHWLTKKEEDIHHSQKYETFVAECDYLAQRAVQNDIWVCSFNDMIKYIYVRDNSEVVINDGKLSLKSELDPAIFDCQVTVLVDGKAYNVGLGEEISL